MWTLNAVWQLIISSFSIANIIGAAAVAVALFLPKPLDWITDLRKWAIVVAVCAFGYSAVAAHHFSNGLSVKQSEWDAARVAADNAKTEREAAIAAKAAEIERAKVTDEQSADRKSIEDLKSYVATLKSRVDSACTLTDDDAAWLSNH